MVWFQCDDCGENLKKPKLLGHFRCCSASRLSCIDCGAEFDQRSAQQHTQCVSETVKYGPKSAKGAQPKPASGAPKEDDEAASTMGLSARPPWSCSLCNVKATSRETLAVHGQGKKHKAKARAAMKAQGGEKSKTEQRVEGHKEADAEVEAEKAEVEAEKTKVEAEKAEVEAEKKEHTEKSRKRKKGDGEVNAEVKRTNGVEVNVNGEAEKNKSNKNIQKKVKNAAEEEMNGETEKTKLKKRKKVAGEVNGEKVGSGAAESKDKKDGEVKWRKLVANELKAAENGMVKMRQLAMAVVPRAMEQVQVPVDEKALKLALKEYLASSSEFEVHGKYVQRRASPGFCLSSFFFWPFPAFSVLFPCPFTARPPAWHYTAFAYLMLNQWHTILSHVLPGISNVPKVVWLAASVLRSTVCPAEAAKPSSSSRSSTSPQGSQLPHVQSRFVLHSPPLASAASLPRSPRWSDVKWNFLGSTRYFMPSAAAAAALVAQPQRTRLTVSNVVKPSIQFIRGVDELSVPDVALTRSKDGLNGVATFTFDQPSVFDSSKELGDITGLYLVDDEGVLTSVDVSAKFLNGKPAKIEAKYVMKNVSEWDRFMRFMERYAAANNLGFVKK